MKRFTARLTVFAGIHLIIFSCVVLAYSRRFPPAESYYAALIDKQSLLETQAAPRMVFIGGSSMAIGMDSALVAGSLGYHPVNMGMNMAVGMELMLDTVEMSLRPGDVVVVAPEIYTFQDHFRANPECMARLVECNPSMLASMPFRRVKNLLDAGYAPHFGRILRVVTGLGPQETLWDGLVNTNSSRRAFNENGDLVAVHNARLQRGGRLRFEFKSIRQAEEAVARLNRFHEHCRSRNVRVFFSHAPYERAAYNLYKDAIQQLEAVLKSKLTIPMLDTSEEMLFPTAEILDLEYHLNLAGKRRHSQMVAERLRVALAGSVPKRPNSEIR